MRNWTGKCLSEHAVLTRGDVSGDTGSADLQPGDIPGTHFRVFHQLSIILDAERHAHVRFAALPPRRLYKEFMSSLTLHAAQTV